VSVRMRVSVDTSEVRRDLRRVDDGPDRRHLRRFESILTRQFQQTQIRVHVITGSLRASGRHDSETRRNGGWKGAITYGGGLVRTANPGPPANPVKYAKYEYTKPFDEGYDHNFFRDILRDDDYADVILDWLGGRR
jgi:hypothetical protein